MLVDIYFQQEVTLHISKLYKNVGKFTESVEKKASIMTELPSLVIWQI